MNILVAGAGRGIGAMLATELVTAGHAVAGVARSPAAPWAVPASVHRVECDAADERAVRRGFSALRKAEFVPEAVIIIIGAFSADLLVTAGQARLEAVFAANVVAADNVMREAARSLLRTGGRVVVMSSIAAHVPFLGNGLYAASKAALESLVRSYALELRGTGCTFNAVAVSFVAGTAMVEALGDDNRAADSDRLLVPGPMGIHPVARVVELLIAPEGAWINGQVISLGGPY